MVRGVEVVAVVAVNGVVRYKISVQATEGRHWHCVRRYSDFRVLEQNTWKTRGPMPPFPYAWEGLQIVLHLVEPVIQRERRLDAKRVMLQDWLERLVQRARRSQSLQKHVNIFLDVAACYEGADTRLLLDANNVTSLVVTNPQANVEQILLKLSAAQQAMATTRGKQTLNRALAGPDAAVEPLPVDLDAIPTLLIFDLSRAVPTVRLAVSNHCSRPRAFKVMATEPTRYFVTPAQTLLPPRTFRVVSIFIPDGFDPVERYADDTDRFLFVTADLDAGRAGDYGLGATDLSGGGGGGEDHGGDGARGAAEGKGSLAEAKPTPSQVVWPAVWQAPVELRKRKLAARFSHRPGPGGRRGGADGAEANLAGPALGQLAPGGGGTGGGGGGGSTGPGVGAGGSSVAGSGQGFGRSSPVPVGVGEESADKRSTGRGRALTALASASGAGAVPELLHRGAAGARHSRLNDDGGEASAVEPSSSPAGPGLGAWPGTLGLFPGSGSLAWNPHGTPTGTPRKGGSLPRPKSLPQFSSVSDEDAEDRAFRDNSTGVSASQPRPGSVGSVAGSVSNVPGSRFVTVGPLESDLDSN